MMKEMEMVNGGDTLDHVAGALMGVTVGAMVGSAAGFVAGAPGCVIGMGVGAVGGGVSCGILGISKVKNWVRQYLPTKK